MNKFMQKLIYNSIELQNNNIINDYYIRENSTIYLQLIINDKFYQKNLSEYYLIYST